MQGINHLPAAPRETFGKAGAIALALAFGLSLAACQGQEPGGGYGSCPRGRRAGHCIAARHCRACTCRTCHDGGRCR